MDYVIAIAATLWMLPFLWLERRRGGPSGYLWRLVGVAPFVVLAALAWKGQFKQSAFAIPCVVVVVLVLSGALRRVQWRNGSPQKPALDRIRRD